MNSGQVCKLGHVRISGQYNIWLTASGAFLVCMFFSPPLFADLPAWFIFIFGQDVSKKFGSYLINLKNKNIKSLIFCCVYFYCFTTINNVKMCICYIEIKKILFIIKEFKKKSKCINLF